MGDISVEGEQGFRWLLGVAIIFGIPIDILNPSQNINMSISQVYNKSGLYMVVSDSTTADGRNYTYSINPSARGEIEPVFQSPAMSTMSVDRSVPTVKVQDQLAMAAAAN